MRSVRNRVAVAGIILAVSGCTAASPAADAHKAFHLDKTCAAVGCTIVSSDLAAIPVGTLIKYTDIGDGSTRQSNATFVTKDGTASGFCDFNHDGKPLAAQCTLPVGNRGVEGVPSRGRRHLDRRPGFAGRRLALERDLLVRQLI